MMGALTSLWNSEKGLAGGLLIVGATVLVALGQMDATAWIDYTKWIFGIYVAGKTGQGIATVLTSGISDKKVETKSEEKS